MDGFDPIEEKGSIPQLPTIAYYRKSYAPDVGTDEKRALKYFSEFESPEKKRRLRGEIQAVRDGRATQQACDLAIGKAWKGRHDSYENWANFMLACLSQIH